MLNWLDEGERPCFFGEPVACLSVLCGACQYSSLIFICVSRCTIPAFLLHICFPLPCVSGGNMCASHSQQPLEELQPCGLPFLKESDSLEQEQEGSQCCAFLFIWRLLCCFCFILTYSTVCVCAHLCVGAHTLTQIHLSIGLWGGQTGTLTILLCLPFSLEAGSLTNPCPVATKPQNTQC